MRVASREIDGRETLTNLLHVRRKRGKRSRIVFADFIQSVPDPLSVAKGGRETLRHYFSLQRYLLYTGEYRKHRRHHSSSLYRILGPGSAERRRAQSLNIERSVPDP
jgi:hypothetical protein